MADASDGRQIAEGVCRIEAEDGAVAFGAFECAGYRLVGCAGPFTLDGGEGRLAGVTGGGPMVLRRTGTALAAGEDGRIVEGAVGVASWKGLQIEAGAQ